MAIIQPQATRGIRRDAEVRLDKLPRYFEQGEDAPTGWGILAETWLFLDGRTVGVRPYLTRVGDGWLVSYETVPETTLEKLLNPDPWDCRECRTIAEPSTPGWTTDYGVSPPARFCPDCVEQASLRRKYTPWALA
jgi:hypothetical protein